MAEWIVTDKIRAGLRRQTVVYPNMTGRTKERIAYSKRARVGPLAIVDQPQMGRICILRAFLLAPMPYICLSPVYFFSAFLFRFRLFAFL